MRGLNDSLRPILLLACALAGAGACRGKEDMMRRAFTKGMQAYLQHGGDLCVGRPRWPIDVPAGEDGTANAVQLPVLEQLGLVASKEIQVRQEGVATPFRARRYRLTPAGHALYLDRETRLPAAPDDPRAPQRADLCFAKLTLRDVTRWEIQNEGQSAHALVSYTYDVQAPGVAGDPRFQKVFPAVARLLADAGHAELIEPFTLAPQGWTADQLLPAPNSAGAQAVAP